MLFSKHKLILRISVIIRRKASISAPNTVRRRYTICILLATGVSGVLTFSSFCRSLPGACLHSAFCLSSFILSSSSFHNHLIYPIIKCTLLFFIFSPFFSRAFQKKALLQHYNSESTYASLTALLHYHLSAINLILDEYWCLLLQCSFLLSNSSLYSRYFSCLVYFPSLSCFHWIFLINTWGNKVGHWNIENFVRLTFST